MEKVKSQKKNSGKSFKVEEAQSDGIDGPPVRIYRADEQTWGRIGSYFISHIAIIIHLSK